MSGLTPARRKAAGAVMLATADVVDAGLAAAFGSLLDPNNTVPGLSTDNVGTNDKPFSTTFPYLAPPTQ